MSIRIKITPFRSKFSPWKGIKGEDKNKLIEAPTNKIEDANRKEYPFTFRDHRRCKTL